MSVYPQGSTSRTTLDSFQVQSGSQLRYPSASEPRFIEVEVEDSQTPTDGSDQDGDGSDPAPSGLTATQELDQGLPTPISGLGGPMTGLQQVAHKSCVQCRVRKVKCDRIWPGCGRCRKRREQCEYGDVSLAIQLRTTESTKKPRDDRGISDTTHFAPYIKPPATAKSSKPLQTSTHLATHHATVNNDMKNLWQSFMRSNIGEQSVDWKLAKPAMASSLTLHLLEASRHSCCFHLPAFHVFANRIRQLESRLGSLDIQGEVIVAVLASLGARASPHSALIGVDGPDLDVQKALSTSHEFVLAAGARREQAWKAIADRAVALCSSREILQTPSQQNVEILVALIQMLMLSKVRPIKSRFFLRNVVGMFADLQGPDSEVPLSEVLAIKRSVGRTLYECDARVAAYSSSPLFISDEDVQDLYCGTGVVVPDLERDELGPMLDSILDERTGPIDREKLDDAIALAGYWICALQRAYAKMASARRITTSYLYEVPRLWEWVDRAHQAVQALHRRLFALQQSGVRNIGGDHDIEYDLLIAVRLDARLIDLLNLTHEFLRRQLATPANLMMPQESEQLNSLFALSDKRVRKGLKLTAFYFKVFVDSLDKHMVYHLVVQLQALPSWALIAPQRAGEETAAGPLISECELSERELDWLQSALELACFFTPLAHDRLQELKSGREMRKEPATEADVLPYSYEPTIPSTHEVYAQHSQLQPTSVADHVPPPIRPASVHILPSPVPQAAMRPPAINLASPSLSPFTFDSYGTPSFRTSSSHQYLNGGAGGNDVTVAQPDESWSPQQYSFSSIYNMTEQSVPPAAPQHSYDSVPAYNTPMMYTSQLGPPPSQWVPGQQDQVYSQGQSSWNSSGQMAGLSSDRYRQ